MENQYNNNNNLNEIDNNLNQLDGNIDNPSSTISQDFNNNVVNEFGNIGEVNNFQNDPVNNVQSPNININQDNMNNGMNNIENIDTLQNQLIDNGVNINQPITGVEPVQNNTKNNIFNNKKLLCMIVFGVLVVGVILLLLLSKSSKNELFDEEINEFTTTSFFIENNKKYALFNMDGKKLTDFIYDDVSEFANGVARVSKDEKYGIIDANGKMVVDFGKYSYIIELGGLYFAKVNKNEPKAVILNAKGKEIYEDVEYKISDYHTSSHNDKLMFFNQGNNGILVNYNGKEILKLKNSEYKVVDVKRKIEDNYAVVSIQKGEKSYINHVIDIENAKIVYTYEADIDYEIYEINKNNKLVLRINSESTMWSGYNGKYEHELEVDLKLSKNHEDTYYANYNEKDKSVSFYKNDKVIKEIKNYILYSANGGSVSKVEGKNYYLLANNKCEKVDSKCFELYDVSGKKIVDLPYYNVKYICNDRLVVSEKGNYSNYAPVKDKIDDYYIIDLKNKKINKDSYISITGHGSEKCIFEAKTKDKSVSILDENGKKILDREVSGINEIEDNMFIVNYYDSSVSKSYYAILDKDGKVLVPFDAQYISEPEGNAKKFNYYKISGDKKIKIYDAKNKKIVLELPSDVTIGLEKKYFSVKYSDNKVEYYSYLTGKKFYESK